MSKTLKNLLQQAKRDERAGAPRSVWVASNRETLLMQARNTMDTSVAPGPLERLRGSLAVFFPFESFVAVGKAAFVFLLAAGTLIGGGIASAQLYSDAVPGNMLYGAKLAVERVQLTLAPTIQYRTLLSAEFADRRVDEIAKLAEGNQQNFMHIPQVLAALNATVASLGVDFEQLRTSDPQGVGEVAKLLERKIASQQQALRKAGVTVSADMEARIAQTNDAIDSLAIRAIAVIVEKYDAGDANVPGAVVAVKVEDRLNSVETKIETASVAVGATADTKAKTTKARAVIAVAKELIKQENYQAALSKIAEVVELAKEVDDQAKQDAPATDLAAPAQGETQAPASSSEPAPTTEKQPAPAPTSTVTPAAPTTASE